MYVRGNTTSEGNLHAMDKHEVRTTEGAATSHRDDIANVDAQLIQIALNPSSTLDQGHAAKVPEWKLR